MAPSREMCFFCARDLNIPQDGSSLEGSTDAKICDPCSAAFKDGTFCLINHKDDVGWKQCERCVRQVHCSCIMALNSFDVIEGSAIICKECAKKPSFMAPNIGASSSAPNPVDYSQLDVSSIFENLTGEDFLTDALMSDDLDNQENVAIEVNRNVYQPPHPELTFLFEKVLTRTDCNPGPNRFLLPKHLAEAFLPMPPDEQKMPLAVKDTQGRTWNFVMRWWPHKNGRKYVLDGVRSCIQTMKWETGNTLKFYRQFPSGEHVIVLERNPDAA